MSIKHDETCSRKDNTSSVKSGWVSMYKKYLVLFLLHAGLIQTVRMLYLNNVNVVVTPTVVYSESRIAEVEAHVNNIVEKVSRMEDELIRLDKYLRGNELLSKGEFDRFLEDKIGKGGSVDLDQVIVLAREIVTKEIEKHAADELGRVDYALASAGSIVTSHSQADYLSSYIFGNLWNWVDPHSVKMIRPSFGKPDDCFALLGNTGFVDISLSKSIIPKAVTLEHVAKSVAYDRSSAPKDCRVYAWLSDPVIKMVSLGEFTYDLQKSNAQTFNVLDSYFTNTIRLQFTSNHGNPYQTCIYRFRVHGYEFD